ncbi:PaaI family thioesterase [Demequina soli]|uniref:PaaI family thioesterase n=1 Tax=Demequina soli TaxID=1638987 RepID=UPI000782C72C|nr:PaaI family thioesterase [Demequina soli]
MSDADDPRPYPPLEVGLIARMGISIMTVTPDSAVGTMPVEGNTQPAGLLHGGASGVLAETLASVAADAHAKSIHPDGVAMGVDLNITHVRGAREGIVTGTATALHLGRTIAAYRIDVTDEDGALLASARLTCAVRTPR